jgi:sirohydrochlorin cobaltochelatase
MRSGIILFAHGARDPEWARPFERIRAVLERRAPEIAVELAYLEAMQPALPEAMSALAARGVERVTLVPLFMARGNHLRADLPERVRHAAEQNPGLVVRIAPAIGEVEALLQAIAQWVLEEAAISNDADVGNPIA